MKKLFAFFVSIAVLFTCVPVYGLEMSDLNGLQNEEDLKQAIQGEPLWVESFPNGLFNFVGTQYRLQESQEFLEIAIARQGGTAGDVSVDFKAIDVSAEYGRDYVIRVYENNRAAQMQKNEHAVPLIDTLNNGASLNISRSDNEQTTVQQAVYSPDVIAPDLNIPPNQSSGDEDLHTDEGSQPGEPDEQMTMNADQAGDSNPDGLDAAQSFIDLEPQVVELGSKVQKKSLRQLKEAALNRESDRPDWKEVDLGTIEKLKQEYDEFFYSLPGAETTIEFKDGEYIKYLYIVPLNDSLSESEEQILFALTNPTGGAARGEFYMAYANIGDDEEVEASTFELNEELIVAENGQASVIVRRTGGLNQYASVYIGTETNTAVPEIDYVPGLQELLFTPGMTEQTIMVDILQNPKREQTREFTIALDRENKNVIADKSQTRVLILPEPDPVKLLAARDYTAPDYLQSAIYDNRGVEKISPYGYSPQKGQWAVVGRDFLAGSSSGTAYSSGDELRLRTNGSTSYAESNQVKLYGVSGVHFEAGNAGCGYHWTDSYFFGLIKEARSQHEFSTSLYVKATISILNINLTIPGVLWSQKGNFGRKGIYLDINETLWQANKIGFTTTASSNNQSTADIGWLRLYLKEYSLQLKNDEANVPKFSTTEYSIQNQNLKKVNTIFSSQPGSLSIKSIYSNVGNSRNFTPLASSAGVYRSDMIEFAVSYADNAIGRNSYYDGFEVYTGNGWTRFEGTTLKLDPDFFAKSGILNGIRGGTIQVRPVFRQREVNLTLNIDKTNGYIEGLGETVAEKTFANLKAGDIIHASAKNFLASRTPSWSSSNNAKLVDTDETGAKTSVKFELTTARNELTVSFLNPTLVVRANPNVYKHNVSKPKYRVDGVLYEDSASLTQKMDLIFEANSDDNPANDQNPEISIIFDYVYDQTFPDPDNIFKTEFGNPSEAVLTIYKSDGTVRGRYSSNKPQNSMDPYTVTALNGRYTYTGRLKELGWESTDYATVIIYGNKNSSNGRLMSTRENVIDYLTGSGNGVTVKKPDNTLVGGDIYTPIVISDGNPLNNYEMTAYAAPGYTTKWRDYSGDLDGDGQESDDETEKLRSRMASYGINLDDIRSNPNNASYEQLFWGSFFNYSPKFYNPSQILYNFEKIPEDSSNWTAYMRVFEKYRTVLDPNTPSNDLPLQGVTVIIGNKAYETDENGLIMANDPTFEEGLNYMARVMHKGYEFYTYVQPGRTVRHVFDTSDIMRPIDFSAQYTAEDSESPEDIELDAAHTLVPVRSGETEFQFRVDSGKEGVRANDAIIRVYQTNLQGYRTDIVYEARTGIPAEGIFTHAINLLQSNIKPGNRMTISPLYVENDIIQREYPEVDVGLTFSLNLTAITALASFDTPLQPAVEFLGKLNNKFDLGMDIDLDEITDPGTRVDKDGMSHNTKSISFGFNKDFEKKFGDQKDDEEGEEGKKGVVDKIKDTVGGSRNKAKDTVGDVTGEGKKKGSGGATFKYDFSVSLTLTIEEGQHKGYDGLIRTDGYHYFSSMVLMAKGNADFGAKYTYVTPIGIPVFATIDVTGSATAILAIEANDDDRYALKYRFDGEGKVPINPTEYSIYTKFFITPTVTIGAGAGVDGLKVWIEGTAAADFEFTVPILGENAASAGNGGLTISAAVGIKIMFIQKKWTIYKSRRYELFSYGSASRALMAALGNPYASYLYNQVEPAGEEEIAGREYLNQQSGWMGEKSGSGRLRSFSVNMNQEAEITLKTSAYPYPQTKIIPYGDKLLGLFIQDPGADVRDSRNRAQLFYSIYNGGSWSAPQPIDTDNTWDEAPDAFTVDDKILITWADAHRSFTGADNAKTTLQAMNISGKWFNPADETFGSEFAITKQTELDEKFADLNPMISYDPETERLMVYFTKIDYEDTPWDYDNTPSNDPSTVKNTTDDGDSTALYGDIVNGYNVIAFRWAQKQPDGSFLWNTTYDESEGFDPTYFNLDTLYGQRFLDLAVLVDIGETEVLREPHDATVDEDGLEPPAGYQKGVVGTDQVVTESANKNHDPLVVKSDLISYNGLALYAYVMDADSSRSTTGDQELYLQIYNYELNEFHHPIRLTNNDLQDTLPRFVRSRGITYLYWLSGGDIVYMDITNLVKNNLRKETVQIDGESRLLYIVDKYWTGINGFLHTAVESNPGYPIDDFKVSSNGDSQYLLYTDTVLSYRNGLKAGDPGTENPENLIKEKQIFAAWSQPQLELKEVQLFDAYQDTDEITFEYLPGKDAGTYPMKVTVAESVYNDQNELVFAAGTNIIDYASVPDVNGYKGIVKAGDPVIQKQPSAVSGYPWSKPVQLTHDSGANYSDISFIVNDDQNIQAVYMKYQQMLNEDNVFEEDTTNRIFAFNTFRPVSTLQAQEIVLSNMLPQSEETMEFGTTVTNTGLKPLEGLTYMAYMKQGDEEIAVTEAQPIQNPLDAFDAEQNADHSEGSGRILGGHAAELAGSVELPQDIRNLSVGFRVMDEAGLVILQQETDLKAETDLEITVLGASVTEEGKAVLSLFVRNAGNLGYNGKLEVTNQADSAVLKSLDLNVTAGGEASLLEEITIQESMFGPAVTADDGSMFDRLSVLIKAGEYSVNADIQRTADSETVAQIQNVKSFTVNKTSLALESGSTAKLNAVKELYQVIPENTADPLELLWRTSDSNVAAVLPDGTVAALSPGTAVITASLAPANVTTATLTDGTFTDVDTRYRLPAGLILKRTISVSVTSGSDDSGSQTPTATPKPTPIPTPVPASNTTQKNVPLQVTPVTVGETSVIRPDLNAVTQALQQMNGETGSMLLISASEGQRSENSELVLTTDIIGAILNSGAAGVAFETSSGRMVLEPETLEILQQLLEQTGGEQEVTIGIRRAEVQEYPEGLAELIGSRPVYDFELRIGGRSLAEITSEPVPMVFELEGMASTGDSASQDQIVGAYLTEDGQYRLLPMSAMVNGRLVIRTTHNSLYTGIHNAVNFTDVAGWSKEYIDFLAAREIVNGVGGNLFKPSANITRAEFVKILAETVEAEIKPVAVSSFTDVDINKWYAPYVEWAYASGLVNGVGNGRFAPEESITRQDMAVLIARLAESLEFTLPQNIEPMAFADRKNISDYALPSVKAVQQAGIVNGLPGAVFAPKQPATREECAKMITILIKLIVGQ